MLRSARAAQGDHHQLGSIADAVERSVPSAPYSLLDTPPGSRICALVATTVVTSFFVTSSDSGSLVIDILSADGDPASPIGQRIFWSLVEGAAASILLVVGGLRVLQIGAITTALPLVLLMVAMCACLVVALRRDPGRATGPQGGPAARVAAVVCRSVFAATPIHLPSISCRHGPPLRPPRRRASGEWPTSCGSTPASPTRRRLSGEWPTSCGSTLANPSSGCSAARGDERGAVTRSASRDPARARWPSHR
ncbi:MAG: BCCT family transporter [Polyangiaceae bacterium]|nr:BCCT family transporter [Polyangiaceae bacterium]